MATRKKSNKKVEEPVEVIEELTKEKVEEPIVNTGEVIEELEGEKVEAPVEAEPVKIEQEEKKKSKAKKDETPKPKYAIGSIVYIRKEADADLNGFKLFPQYKKYTYTVEAYDQISGIYTLRRLNLSLNLKECFIVSPDERAHDEINRMQF